jgi:hypothetical protein
MRTARRRRQHAVAEEVGPVWDPHLRVIPGYGYIRMARAGRRRAGDGKTIFHQNEIVSLKHTKHLPNIYQNHALTRVHKTSQYLP